MNKLQISRVLMIATILVLAAFEGYWLNKLYRDEYKGLNNGVEVAFRGAIDKLQRRLYEKDTSLTALVIPDTDKQHITALNTSQTVRQAPRTKRKEQHRRDHKEDSTFHFRFDIPEMRDETPPHEGVQAIAVHPVNEIAGVPPPRLVELMLQRKAELMLREKMTLRDSARQMMIRKNGACVRLDSTSLKHLRKGFPSITISYSNTTRDSASHRSTRDTFVKINGIEKIDHFEWKNNADIAYHPQRMRAPANANSSVRLPMPAKIESHLRRPPPPPEEDTILTEPVPEKIQTKKRYKPSPDIVTFFSTNRTLNDSIPVARVDSAYKAELAKLMNGYPPYNISFKSYRNTLPAKADFEKDSTKEVTTSKVFVGFNTPYAYQAHFSGVQQYILGKMRMQIGGSVLLLLLVLISFIIMYRNILAQQKLANIKNDFISNITHELKTPIATVSVAIEALRNFNAIRSPEKTKEYLDISASELQRLGLLVDKVLKLSIFENKRVELKKEQFDMKALIDETLATMRLQLEKQNAQVSFTTEGSSFLIEADKLHITSVIYNLLDNALKYSAGVPVIQIALKAVQENILELKMSDNGVGIAHQYQQKVFDKFFRVPMGNQHNIKGYGLGLSYVAEIVKQHMGYIYVESILGKGSAFIVKLPVAAADEIRFDEHRVIRKKTI